MPLYVLEAIMPIFAIVSIGSMILIGMKIKQGGKVDSAAGASAIEDLREEVARLGDQVHILNEEVAEAHERLEFAERLLARGKHETREEVDTPV
ncbi:MAG: hypothetical protein OEZ54_07490 [Gemmatimonadota bacterium]|nr:hypothetical protein [Gemmatimonadota bacterium]